METIKQCPVCGSMASCSVDEEHDLIFYRCPVCGKYEWSTNDHEPPFNKNQLAAYLAHHAIMTKDNKPGCYTTLETEICKNFNQAHYNGSSNRLLMHIDADIIANWYPKRFAEKIDYILSYMFAHAPHLGQIVYFSIEQLYSFLFIDRYEALCDKQILKESQQMLRKSDTIESECNFMLNYLKQQGYIQQEDTEYLHDIPYFRFTLMPQAYARIDEIQKNTANGKNVFVAMSFNNTKKLRENIRQGIKDAEYNPIFIDEVQHNDFITPELLKYIRDSKFVVVDLTHLNNGAYLEEGYAMGLGKPVIQLCKKGVQLHFDIAQKNTIIWESEDEIPERLKKRIIATIE